MTVRLPTRDLQRVQDALRSRGALVSFLLSIDDLEVGDKLFSGTWGQNDAGVIATDLSFTGRLPVDYRDAPSTLAVVIDGVIVPQMVGLGSLPEISVDMASTKFISRSAKGEASELTLNEEVSYPGVAPELVVKDAVSRLPYLRGASTIEPLAEPTLYFQGKDRFLPEEKVGDIFDEVEKQTPYVIRDNALGGNTTSKALEPKRDLAGDYRTYNATDMPKWRPPPPIEKRYREVVVYARGEDGNYLFEPVTAAVQYKKNPPLSGSKLWIHLDSPDIVTPQRARSVANETARGLSRGVFRDDSVILPHFDAVIEMMDTFLVYEDWEDMAGMWSRLWMCWVNTYKHDYVTLSTEVAHTATLLQNDRIVAPVLAMPGLSTGNKKTVYEVCDEIGGLILIDSSASWAEEDDGEITLATGAGTVFEDDGEITVTCPAPNSVELWGVA